jgi:hypothetical protein
MKDIGIGIVAQDKNGEGVMISVHSNQMNPTFEGKVEHNFDNIIRSGKDHEGNEYTARTTVGTTIIAKWLRETNKTTCPSVKQGEQVKLYQLADTTRYYWQSMGNDGNLRRTEEINNNYAASSTPEGKPDYRHETNQYHTSLDTENGLLSYQTSMNNGEKAGYNIQFDGMSGKVIVEDHKGNGFTLDSVKNNFIIKIKGTKDNKGKEKGAPTFISLEDGVITLNATTIRILGNQETTGSVTTEGDVTTTGKVNANGVASQSDVTGPNLMYKP